MAKRPPRFDPSLRFKEALAFAADLHKDQPRKGTDIPYISHLLAVASLALEHGAGEDEAIAALLHDALEDVGGHLREPIEARFGRRVLDIVERLTDADADEKETERRTGDRAEGWKRRKEQYLAHLKEERDPGVVLVSACDKLHNARCILADVRQDAAQAFEKFNGGREGTLWYYRSVADAFQALGTPVAAEIGRVVAELDALAQES